MLISMMVQIFRNLTPLLPRMGCPAPKCRSEYTPCFFTILCSMLFRYIFMFEGQGSPDTSELGRTGRCAETILFHYFFFIRHPLSLSLSLLQITKLFFERDNPPCKQSKQASLLKSAQKISPTRILHTLGCLSLYNYVAICVLVPQICQSEQPQSCQPLHETSKQMFFPSSFTSVHTKVAHSLSPILLGILCLLTEYKMTDVKSQ